MAEELLKLQNIYKNFGNVKVLKDVNIKINKGEVVALIGDNGAGKSTLIKVITGVHSPNSGKVFFKEKEVQIKSVAQSRKMGIMKQCIKKEHYVISKNYTEISLQEEKLQIHLVFGYKKTKKRSRKNFTRLYRLYFKSYNS